MEGESVFTFQYGQIYYTLGEPQAIPISGYLHSNMVRFIIDGFMTPAEIVERFTFQYGQIYYILQKRRLQSYMPIYIPIWLDLLFDFSDEEQKEKEDLHSNMVRFIINLWSGTITLQTVFTFQYGQIYYQNQQNKI